MKHLAALAVIVAFVWPAAAGAKTFSSRTLQDAHVGPSKAEVVAQKNYSARVVAALRGSWKVAPRHATCWSHVPWSKTCDRSRRRLLAHRWLYERADAIWRRRYAPKPVVATAGHWALWSCITNGAYPGAAHEGNGYNVGPGYSYVGPLGMTTPWAGHYPTGGDWVHTPIAVVYGYAEQEFAANGYSIAWLYGQWPNTSPPCVAKGLA